MAPVFYFQHLWQSFLDELEPLKQAALAELQERVGPARPGTSPQRLPGRARQVHRPLKQLVALSKEERPAAGKLINQIKIELESALTERRAELELKAALPKEPTDFTLPDAGGRLGKLHPLTQVTEDIVRIFRKIGFVVADGPEIEDEYHCFDALNTPADHPARDAQDTFYLGRRRNRLLSAHAHFLRADPGHGKAAAARCGSLCPGGSIGATMPTPRIIRLSSRSKDFMWTSDVTVGDLKGTIEFVFRQLLGNEVKIRLRPHYFSYTEPSFEVDFSSPLVKKMGKDGWKLPVAAWCIRKCSRLSGMIRRSGRAGPLALGSNASP